MALSGGVPRGGRAYRYFEVAVVVAIFVLVSVGVVGLALAILGHARPVPVFTVSAVVAAALLVLWRPDRVGRPADAPRVPVAIVVGALVVVVASGATNALNHAQYVRTDRDPGIYTAGGLWIAANGNLVVEGRGPGLDGVSGLETSALGQQTLAADDSRLEIQGTHLFPVLLAAGDWIGGDTGFEAVPAVIGMVALGAFFLLAVWFLPPWAALVSLVALAVNFVFVYGVRSTLSEPTTLLFAVGGTWLALAGLRARSPARLAVAGVVVGATLATRIDGGVAVLALPPALALAARRRELAERSGDTGTARRRSRTPWLLTGAFAAGMSPVIALARLDLHRRSAFYLHFHNSQVGQVEKGLLVGLVAALGVLSYDFIGDREPLHRLAHTIARHRRSLARVVVVAVVACFAALWFVRPLLGPVHGDLADVGGKGEMEAIQRAEGSEPDGSRTYAEVAVDRLSWYVGPAAVVLGVGGIALVSKRVIEGDDLDDGLVLASLAVPTTLLYLWQPSIFPDNPWMLRRYLPVVIPSLLVFAAIATVATADRFRGAVPARGPLYGRIVAVAASVLLVAAPLRITIPLRAARWQAGGMDGIHRLCDTVGRDAAVVFSYAGQSGITLLPSFRAVCGVPAARASAAQYQSQQPLPLEELQESVRRAGRRLWVVANSEQDLRVMAPNVQDPVQVTIFDTREVTRTLRRPPRGYTPKSLVVWAAYVPPGPN